VIAACYHTPKKRFYTQLNGLCIVIPKPCRRKNTIKLGQPSAIFLTVLARDWHEIDPEDKAAIAELGKFDSFPDWALHLKLKYIDEEKARQEALDATLEVLKGKVATKNRTATMSVNPSAPSFGAQNRIVTKDKADAAKVSLKAMLSQMNVDVDSVERKQVEGAAQKAKKTNSQSGS
jgi:hypothetical protein